MTVPHSNGGNIIWTCGKDNIYHRKGGGQCNQTTRILIYFFEEEEGGGARKRIYEYPYLKQLIELRPGDWDKQLGDINGLIREKKIINRNLGNFLKVISGNVLGAYF